jgi:ACS family tartrate transporter-like MFS transporter
LREKLVPTFSQCALVDANAGAPAGDGDIERVVAKVVPRVVPLLVAGFFVAYLDRVNIGFAALTMNKELGFTPEFFGLAAGVFFIGYCLFEAPSNYILHRVGARLWIARIMVSWGAVSALAAFVRDGSSFIALRLLLGAAEAGFAPGAILYLTTWIPAAQRARVIGAFLLAVPLSSAIGAPISSVLLSAMDGVAGFSGWRWLFFLEALPSILLGALCFFHLPDRLADAEWLTAHERDSLQTALARDAAGGDESPWRVLRNPRALTLGLAYFGVVIALYGLGFWLPQIIDALGYGVVAAGFLTAIPYMFGAAAMALWSRRSDRSDERVRHTALAAVVSSVGLAASSFAPTPPLAMAALSVASVGTLAAMPTFWSFATLALGPVDAIIGVAVVNAIGNIAGLAGPYLVGVLKGATGDFHAALLALSVGPLVTAAFILWLGRRTTR